MGPSPTPAQQTNDEVPWTNWKEEVWVGSGCPIPESGIPVARTADAWKGACMLHGGDEMQVSVRLRPSGLAGFGSYCFVV